MSPVVWKQDQRRWSCDRSPGHTLPFSWQGRDFTEWNKAAMQPWWLLEDNAVICGSVRRQVQWLDPTCWQFLSFPKSLPRRHHSRPVRCVFVQVAGQLPSLKVTLFSFQFSYSGSLKGDKLMLLGGWACCCCCGCQSAAWKKQWFEPGLPTAASRLPGTTQFGEEQKKVAGSGGVWNCNEFRVSRCILLRGSSQLPGSPLRIINYVLFLKQVGIGNLQLCS